MFLVLNLTVPVIKQIVKELNVFQYTALHMPALQSVFFPVYIPANNSHQICFVACKNEAGCLQMQELFFLFSSPALLWSAPDFLFNGYRGFSHGLERPERDADLSTTSNTHVKMHDAISTAPIRFHIVVSNHRAQI
jgi:hypothetical protein